MRRHALSGHDGNNQTTQPHCRLAIKPTRSCSAFSTCPPRTQPLVFFYDEPKYGDKPNPQAAWKALVTKYESSSKLQHCTLSHEINNIKKTQIYTFPRPRDELKQGGEDVYIKNIQVDRFTHVIVFFSALFFYLFI